MIGRSLAILCALATFARADATFEDKARGAEKSDIAELAWLAASKCDRGDDFAQRQCRLVRDDRAAALRGKVLAIDGDPESISEANGTIALARCIRCTAVDVDGAALFANTTGPAARVDRGVLASAKRERASQILPRIEWLVELGATRGAWTVVGYRVIARCDGSIIVASPPSLKVAGDPKRCTPTPVAQPAKGSPDDQLDAARALADAARTCFAKYRVAGEAKLHFSLAVDGSVSSYTRDGFGDSPTGACLDAAAKKVKFPRGDRTQVVTYPIVLR